MATRQRALYRRFVRPATLCCLVSSDMIRRAKVVAVPLSPFSVIR